MPFHNTPAQGPLHRAGRRLPSGLDLRFKVRGSRTGSRDVDEADAMLPGRARRLCEAWLRLAGQEQVAERVTLVATELMTNALRYGTTDTIKFRLGADEDRLKLSVDDGNPSLPSIRAADPLAESGRGMQIVASSVRSGGGELGFSDDGTTTWCTFPIAKERQHV